MEIRPYHPSDLPALYRICLLTGHRGSDASRLYSDPDLLGHYFAGPYALAEPGLCFVVTVSGVPSGYILGTSDTASFAVWGEDHWFPSLRRRYAPSGEGGNAWTEADRRLIQALHRGFEVPAEASKYPAHLHIDLLPVCQGQGLGRRLIEVFGAELRRLGVPGVHLGVSPQNSAVTFYERLGFHRLAEEPGVIRFGREL